MPKANRVKRTHSNATSIAEPSESPHKAKKLKLHACYTLESPFPHFTRPTSDEARQVFHILSSQPPDSPDGAVFSRSSSSSSPLPASFGNSCGHVPNVIEALIDTILSQNTSGKNSSAAKANLDAKFGRNNFAAVACAPREKVVDAIRNGGLANKKAATIQAILRSIKQKHGQYSLQHLATATVDSDAKIMQELMSYHGVGPKTASCVLLFCLGRDSFAVDTHVYRLSKLLGWVPEKADRVLAQAHLDIRIPNELKYGLHVLMVQHGRSCKGCSCRRSRSRSRKSGDGDCILKAYLKEVEVLGREANYQY